MARLLFVEDNQELASLMVATAQLRGHEAEAAHSGQQALGLIGPGAFEAAVVDLLLPDMRGSQVLEALRTHSIPAIAVSGVYKGDRFAREATEVHGARAFFEKPFELTTVLEAVEQTCGASPAPAASAVVSLAPEEEAILEMVDLVVIEDEPARPRPSEPPPAAEPLEAHASGPAPLVQAAPAEAAEESALEALSALEELAAAPQPPSPAAEEPREELRLEPDEDSPRQAPGEEPAQQAPGGKAPQEASSKEPPQEAPTLSLPFAQREGVWAKQEASRPAPPRASRRALPEWTLQGELKQGTIPRLLNAYYQARHNGELKLKQGAVLKVVYFEAGRVVYAASNLAQERFARFCARRGLVPESASAPLASLLKEGVRSGEALVRLGVLTEEQRRQLIEEQVREIVGTTLSWTEGAYGFSPMRPRRADLVKLSVFPGDIILEGVQRTETLVALRQRMVPSRRLFPTADPPYGLHELKLSGPQALLLAYADGSKTVEDLLALTDLSAREALATLRAFELLGVLEERREEPSRSRISFGL